MNTHLISICELLQKAALFAEHNTVAKAEARCRGESFNVFRVCGVNHYENSHSIILAEWLNPSGTHGQGPLFLNLFIETALKDFSDSFNTEKATAHTEYSAVEGRLDILIEDNAGRAIIIENKIYAEDQVAQLKRYECFARKKYHDGGYRLLYLTLDGSEASDQSGAGVNYVPISYRSTIIKWIDACIASVFDKPFLRETMIQYKNLIKQLTGQDMDKTIEKDLIDEMLRLPEGAAAIIKAYPEWERRIIENKIINPLEVFAKEKGLTFSVSPSFWSKSTYEFFEFGIMPNLRIVFQNQKKEWHSFLYGVGDQRPDKKESNPLPSLDSPNSWWPYGSHYLDFHRDWTIDDIVEISQDKGKFVKYICDTVDKMIDEMKKSGIIQ